MKKRILILAFTTVLAMMLSSCGEKKNTLSVVGETTLEMGKGDKEVIELKQSGNGEIEWISQDTTVATVDSEGTVTAVGDGVTTITAKTHDSYVHVGVIVDDFDEYIDEKGNRVPIFNGESDITDIVVGSRYMNNEITVKKGEKHQLYAKTTPSDSTDPIVWQVENSAVVRISEDGNMEAVGAGMTNVTATAPNGIKGTIKITVK